MNRSWARTSAAILATAVTFFVFKGIDALARAQPLPHASVAAKEATRAASASPLSPPDRCRADLPETRPNRAACL